MLIELKNISFDYLPGSPAAVRAVRNVNLTITAGEFTAVVGPTGSGKSTLLQIMAGLLEPTEGSVRVEAEDSVGFIMQQPEKQLFESTVFDDIAFWPRNTGLDAPTVESKVKAAMGSVDLDYNAYAGRSPFTLSGGEKRKTALAGVLVMKPKLLLMDEPTVGLDHRGKSEFIEVIKEANAAGASIVMITHDMDDAAELAERVLVMKDGRVTADAAPREIFSGRGAPAGAGIGLPTAVGISRLLVEKGMDINGDPLTLAELAESIAAALERASA